MGDITMKKILLITTGGTLACTATPSGLEPTMDGEEILESVPEIGQLAQVEVEEPFLIDSTNMELSHWQKLAAIIYDAYQQFDGFVITMGTDTMAYTAAALSKMCVNLGKPVVLTGAQLPLGFAHTDARNNLQLAFSMAVGSVPGVLVAFGNKVVLGHAAKKIFTNNFNAFESVNELPVVCFTKEGLKKHLPTGQVEGEFQVDSRLDKNVLPLVVTPGSNPQIIDWAIATGYKGIVLECLGAGGVPVQGGNWLPAIKRAVEAGVKIVCITQCLFEGVDMERYPMGKAMKKMGVQDGGQMTLEYALVSLMSELGRSK